MVFGWIVAALVCLAAVAFVYRALVFDFIYHSAFGAWLYSAVVTPFTMVYASQKMQDPLKLLPANASVLDVGTGPGLLPIMLQDRFPHLNFVAIDYSPQMIALAAKNLESHAGTCQIHQQQLHSEHKKEETSNSHTTGTLSFQIGNALNLADFHENQFQSVVSHFVIKHLPSSCRAQVIRECVRVLHPGDQLHIMEFFHECGYTRLRNLTERLSLPNIWLLKVLFALIMEFVLIRDAPPLKQMQAILSEFDSKKASLQIDESGLPFFQLTITKS
eukprot:TRINITY_DN1420_c0_g1_i1.p1 TRINITY_DN1420_c0_g1~~TRINITY_DN1420_c0_g1_i1.p1  ORF type:complete len:274 (-),score=44.06 TRINITY_DN1420_c0_g1_i1:184-1005(-)